MNDQETKTIRTMKGTQKIHVQFIMKTMLSIAEIKLKGDEDVPWHYAERLGTGLKKKNPPVRSMRPTALNINILFLRTSGIGPT